MPTVILTNWTVYYSSDVGSGGYKQIIWTGVGSPEATTNTVNELYSALADLFSISTHNTANDTVPIQAVTPTVYNIGAFDAGDLEPWFMDPASIQHLTGGSLQTVDWTREVNANPILGNPGIIKIGRSGTAILSTDVGKAISQAGGDTGTLLYVDGTSLWIRPTNCTSTHSWNYTSGNVTCNTHVDTQNVAAISGERLWSNIYTIGSLDSAAAVYVEQNYTKLTSWWSAGHMDRLILVNDGFATVPGLIDSGLLTVYAREYSFLYDHFDTDVSAGGRNPIPLATSTDINNQTASGTIGALTGITFTFGAGTDEDLNNGNGVQPYDVRIDCGGNTIKNFYEYTKYVTRRTYTTTLNGHNGEQYITTGSLRINFDTQTGNFTEGLTVSTSTGTGVIVANHDGGTTGTLIVRDVRGTFSDNQAITDTSTGAALVNGTPTSTLISKTAPFGTFAGGSFFGARGVWIENMAGADANKYTLTDGDGDSQAPPTTISITVSNTVAGDRVSVFRALDGDTSGNINTTYLTSHNTSNAAGNTTIVIDAGTPIPTDTPASGVIRIVDNPGHADHRFRYLSWTGSTFTLVTSGIPSGAVDSVGSNAAISFRENNANLANILPGDIVRNTSDGSPGSWAQVISVALVSGTTYDVTHTPLQNGTANVWVAGNNYSFNNLPVGYNNSDTAYVPFLDATAVGTSLTTSVRYAADRNITTRVRIKGMQPYNNHTTLLTNAGYSASVTRIDDTIAT